MRNLVKRFPKSYMAAKAQERADAQRADALKASREAGAMELLGLDLVLPGTIATQRLQRSAILGPC